MKMKEMFLLRKKYLRLEPQFCSGCGNGIFINCFLEAIEESGIDFLKTVFVSGIGCAAWIPNPHFKAETLHTTHGRSIAFATGIKLANPDLRVVVISGDGDLTTIGGNHLIHAARRNIALTVICINNFLYGMTGGQVGATTPVGAFTSTTPEGNAEPPFDLVKLVLGAGGKFVSRWPLVYPELVVKGIKRALLYGKESFTFSEIISPCFTQYGRRNNFESPAQLLEWQSKIYVPRGQNKKPEQIEFGQWILEEK